MMECATNAQDRLNVNDKLRIAQLAPLHESVPPKLYGGTERVVSYITEELVRRGHEVTLFASGDSQTSAQLVPGCEEGLRMRGYPDVAADLPSGNHRNCVRAGVKSLRYRTLTRGLLGLSLRANERIANCLDHARPP